MAGAGECLWRGRSDVNKIVARLQLLRGIVQSDERSISSYLRINVKKGPFVGECD